jgi:hypothetical protein
MLTHSAALNIFAGRPCPAKERMPFGQYSYAGFKEFFDEPSEPASRSDG